MANSLVRYTSDGSTQQYSFSFGYLRREDIHVLVDGQLYPFSWVDGQRIELTPEDAPEEGAEIIIRRITDRVHRITDFKDGHTLLAGELDASALQNFYLIQEMLDTLIEQLSDGSVNVVSGVGNVSEYIDSVLASAIENSPILATLNSTIIDGLIAEAAARSEAIAAETLARGQQILTEQEARIAAIQSVADDLAGEVTARVDAVDTLAGTVWQQAVLSVQRNDARIADLNAEIQNRIDGDAASNNLIVSEISRVQTETTSEIARVDGIIANVNTEVQSNTAGIIAEQNARANADAAEASRVDALLATVNSGIADNSAAIIAEQTARATADAAEASRVDALIADVASDVSDNQAAINTEATVRANADLAEANRVDGLIATVNNDISSNTAAIQSESTARSTAIDAEATRVDGLIAGVSTDVADNAAAIINEANARATADAAEAARVDGLIAGVNTDVAAVNAAVVAEQTARADGDAALAGSVDILSARFGGTEGAIPLQDQSSFITHYTASEDEAPYALASGESIVNGTAEVDGTSLGRFLRKAYAAGRYLRVSGQYRANALSSSGTSRIQMRLWGLTSEYAHASSTGNSVNIVRNLKVDDVSGLGVWNTFDYTFFIGPNDDVVGIADQGFTDADLDPDMLAVVRFGFHFNHGHPEGSISLRNLRVDDVTEAQFNEASIISEAVARATAIDAEASRVDGLIAETNSNVAENTAAIISETSARTAADASEASRVDGLIAGVNTDITNNSAAITAEANARATADAAEAARVDGLLVNVNSDISDNAAAISDEATARAAADWSEAVRTNGLIAEVETDIATNAAAIVTEANARATADAAEASRVDGIVANLETDIAANQASIVAETNARVTALSSEATRLEGLIASTNSNVTDNTAAIISEASARTASDTAFSSQLSALTTSVNGNSTTISQHTSSLDGLNAQYTLRINNNGHISGFGLASSPSGSEFAIQADKFLVALPTGGTPEALFYVDGSGVFMKNAFIKNLSADVITTGTFNAARIAANSITADKLKANEIFTQKLFLGNNNLVLNGVDNRIEVVSGSSNLIEIGQLSDGGNGLLVRNATGQTLLEVNDSGFNVNVANNGNWIKDPAITSYDGGTGATAMWRAINREGTALWSTEVDPESGHKVFKYSDTGNPTSTPYLDGSSYYKLKAFHKTAFAARVKVSFLIKILSGSFDKGRLHFGYRNAAGSGWVSNQWKNLEGYLDPSLIGQWQTVEVPYTLTSDGSTDVHPRILFYGCRALNANVPVELYLKDMTCRAMTAEEILAEEAKADASAAQTTANSSIRPGNPINASNITTFISGAAIGAAQIKDAAIESAHIGTAAIESAHITDLSVDTIKIKDGAISNRENNSLDGIANFTTTWSLSKAITLTGSQPLFVDFSVDLKSIINQSNYGVGWTFLPVRVFRDGTEIGAYALDCYVCGFQHVTANLGWYYRPNFLRLYDDPGPGTYTYKVEVKITDGSYTAIGNTFKRRDAILSLLQTKK